MYASLIASLCPGEGRGPGRCKAAVPAALDPGLRRGTCHPSLDHPAPHLVELDALEQRLEIAFAEAFVALALDDLEEDRADDVLGEDLEQQALPFGRRAVHENAALLQLGDVLLMALDALGEKLVISLRRVLELDAARSDDVDRLIDVAGPKRDVLDALAFIFAQKLLDLALVVLALVERDPD